MLVIIKCPAAWAETRRNKNMTNSHRGLENSDQVKSVLNYVLCCTQRLGQITRQETKKDKSEA